MARVIPLRPPTTVPLDGTGYRLGASHAGHYADGTHITTHLVQGEDAIYSETVALTNSTTLRAFAEALRARLPGTSLAAIEQALHRLVDTTLKALHADDAEASAPRESQATRLVQLAQGAGVQLWHTLGAEGTPYATIPVHGHHEHWPVHVKGFRLWLTRLFYEAEQKSPSAQGLQDALGTLAARARFDGPAIPVWTRLAPQAGAIYLDLCDDTWRAVEVTAAGWRVVADPPVRFRRTKGMLPLPVPVPGGSLADLRPFCNLRHENDWRLLVSWLVASLRPTGPYPVLLIHGEQGSAKSTLVELLRYLVDPNIAAVRTTPRDERDLAIAATNGHMIALDNVSHLQPWLSDALCRVATGGGFGTRTLYENDEETLFAYERPVLMNGIEELATRGDLFDRSILLYLSAIPDEQRMARSVFWSNVAHVQPQILGALLDVVSHALRTLDAVTLSGSPAWPTSPSGL